MRFSPRLDIALALVLHRLPYAMHAAFTALPVKQITPSNQLSYVLRADFDCQRLLISGDAGCVDFRPSQSAAYYPDVIAALHSLHVIQVAHHAGHNAHFYHCLEAAKNFEQKVPSFLLLSHATLDRYRPSDVFAKFLASVRKEGDEVRLLFTSPPQEPKVRDFKALFAPVVGATSTSGDVRLLFEDNGWVIRAHAVAVP